MNPASPQTESSLSIASRLAIVGAVAVLWLLLAPIPVPSERFHAMLAPLWLLNWQLSGRSLSKQIVVYGAGITLGVAGMIWLSGSMQAGQLGARLAGSELLYKIYFIAGMFVIYNALSAMLSAPALLCDKARELLTAPHGWWLRTLRAGIALTLFAPYLYATFNVHRFKYANATNPQQECNLAYEDVNFRTRDGLALRGWFIPHPRARKAVLLVHGVGANRGDMLGIVPFLHRAGFDILAFDLRGHGDSDGHTTSFGVHEGKDVSAAIEYLQSRRDVKPITAFAFSMGGSALLHAIGENGATGVEAVILDSTFSEFEPLAQVQMAFLPKSIAQPLLKMLSFYSRLEIGRWLHDITPQRHVSKIAPRGLLIMHGDSDGLIPVNHAQQNFAAGREPKQLWIVPGANHCEAWAVAGDEYEKRVVSFINGKKLPPLAKGAGVGVNAGP